MAEIFFILSVFPIYYCFSIRGNPLSDDELAISQYPSYVNYGSTWFEEAEFLEKCDRADDGEDIINCVRLSVL